MVFIYHYTNRAGKDGIYRDKLIRATDAGDGLGKVVRFTELAHDSDRATLIAGIWGATVAPDQAKDKLRYWFKFDSDDLPAARKISVVVGGVQTTWICFEDVPIKDNICDKSRRRPTARTSRRSPTPPPMQSDATRVVLYHYTDRVGKDAIHKDGVIKAKLPHGGEGLGAIMPVAVYFTEIIPTAAKEELIFNMYGTRDVDEHPDFLERTRYWFKFDAKDLPGVKKRDTRLGRNEWVCEQDVPINLTTIVKGQRH